MKTYYFYNEDFCDDEGFDNVWLHPDTIKIVVTDHTTEQQVTKLILEYDFFDLVD